MARDEVMVSRADRERRAERLRATTFVRAGGGRLDRLGVERAARSSGQWSLGGEVRAARFRAARCGEVGGRQGSTLETAATLPSWSRLVESSRASLVAWRCQAFAVPVSRPRLTTDAARAQLAGTCSLHTGDGRRPLLRPEQARGVQACSWMRQSATCTCVPTACVRLSVYRPRPTPRYNGVRRSALYPISRSRGTVKHRLCVSLFLGVESAILGAWAKGRVMGVRSRPKC